MLDVGEIHLTDESEVNGKLRYRMIRTVVGISIGSYGNMFLVKK